MGSGQSSVPERTKHQEYGASKGLEVCPPDVHSTSNKALPLQAWSPPVLDGASTFIQSSVGVDALQTSGHWADARVTLQAAHTAVRVEGVGKRLSLLHVGVRGGEVTWDDHGYGILQLLSTLVPKAGAHGLKVQHLCVNIAQTSARCSSSTTSDCAPSATAWGRGGGGGRVYRAVDVSTCLTVMSEERPLLCIPLLVLSVHGHEAQHC